MWSSVLSSWNLLHRISASLSNSTVISSRGPNYLPTFTVSSDAFSSTTTTRFHSSLSFPDLGILRHYCQSTRRDHQPPPGATGASVPGSRDRTETRAQVGDMTGHFCRVARRDESFRRFILFIFFSFLVFAGGPEPALGRVGQSSSQPSTASLLSPWGPQVEDRK
jgi:hypothetical protein